MARTKAPDFEAQREQILELAAQAFAASSYSSTSMADLAAASGTSKARLYHYYESKEAILFDLLDRYTKRLMMIVTQTEALAARKHLSEQETLAELIRAFLGEYENSRTRHIALLNDVKFLSDSQREMILDQQRDVVAAFTRQLCRVWPEHVNAENQTALTMMLFGMINWTFTWLKPNGRMSYRDFAGKVMAMLEGGILRASENSL